MRRVNAGGFLWTLFCAARLVWSTNGTLHIRLTNGNTTHDGRVQVYYKEQWGPICDSIWTRTDADVVCRSLGYTRSLSAESGLIVADRSISDGGNQNAFADEIRCTGAESNLAKCPHSISSFHSCLPTEAVRVKCENKVPVRLRGGRSHREGRVEVFRQGSWGTVCDHNFGIPEANVVCRILGFAFAKRVRHSEEGVGDIQMDELQCNGDEVNIGACLQIAAGTYNCTHARDVGVECVALPIRLVDGQSSNEGRVDVYYEGAWGTICDDDWTIEVGHVACRMLGYPGASWTYVASFYGAGTGEIVFDSIRCSGQERHLAECNHGEYGIHNCDKDGHTEDSGVICSGEPTAEVRLRGGPDPSQGRLEIFLFGAWGTACRRNWTTIDSSVVCRKLGFFGAADTLASSPTSNGRGVGMVLMQEPRCQGKESDLLQCDLAYPLGVTGCGHDEDVWLSCLKKDNLEARLVDGQSENEGRVEVLHRGQWGTICDDDWNILASNVLCRMLGYDAAESYSCCGGFREGSGEILLDGVQCIGTEENIGHCMRQDYGVHDCKHSEDVWVSCMTYESRMQSNTTVAYGDPTFEWPKLLSIGTAGALLVLLLVTVACMAYALNRIRHYRRRATQIQRELNSLRSLSRDKSSNSYAKSFTKSSSTRVPEATSPPSRAYDVSHRRTTSDLKGPFTDVSAPCGTPANVDYTTEIYSKQLLKDGCGGLDVHRADDAVSEAASEENYEIPDVPSEGADEIYEDVMAP